MSKNNFWSELNVSYLPYGLVYSHLNMELSVWIASFYILVSIATFNLPIVNCQSFQRSNSRGSFAHFVGNPFTRLTASVLATLQVSSLGECTFECINNHECFSVNFGDQAEEGKHICELINTDRFSQPDKFVISQDFHHYNIKVSKETEHTWGPAISLFLNFACGTWAIKFAIQCIS